MSKELIKTSYRVILPSTKNLLEADGKEVQWPREPGYDLLKNLIEPIVNGYLEHVSVLSDFDGGEKFQPADMFVNEEGLIHGLERNEVATAEYRRACLMGRTSFPAPSDPEQLNFIVGPAVLFKRLVWF